MIHGTIQEQLKAKWERKGYNVRQEVSIPYDDTFYRVDLVAERNGERIAIEIGSCENRKLEFLKKRFSKVIQIPYLQRSPEGLVRHICGHTWRPRIANPKACPRCKSRLDNIAVKNKR